MKTSDSNTAMSDTELEGECRKIIDHLKFAGYGNSMINMEELLSRFQKAQKYIQHLPNCNTRLSLGDYSRWCSDNPGADWNKGFYDFSERRKICSCGLIELPNLPNATK